MDENKRCSHLGWNCFKILNFLFFSFLLFHFLGNQTEPLMRLCFTLQQHGRTVGGGSNPIANLLIVFPINVEFSVLPRNGGKLSLFSLSVKKKLAFFSFIRKSGYNTLVNLPPSNLPTYLNKAFHPKTILGTRISQTFFHLHK